MSVSQRTSKVNDQLTLIGKRHEKIELKLTTIAQSVANLQGNQEALKTASNRNTSDVADMQNIRNLTGANLLLD